jgi:glycosyltransferase involved in cell wall biosynthesis
MPLISVVLPTYNTSVSFLREAVDSILAQTFQDFELIVIDDGSTNEAPAYLDSLTDPRIRLIRNERNLGITKSLNRGFRASRGKYIARMDGDDVSVPDRLEKQFLFMESHPEVIVCGSKVSFDRNDTLPDRKKPMDMEGYRIRMLFCNPGPFHPTAVFRRETLTQHQIEYDERLKYGQDYGMWETLSQIGRIYTLPDKLLYFRRHEDSISVAHRSEQIQCDMLTQQKLLLRLLDHVTPAEQELHYRYSTGYYPGQPMTDTVGDWYRRLIAANRQKRIYNCRRFNRYVHHIMLRTILQQPQTGFLKKARLVFRFVPLYAAVYELSALGLKKLFGRR